MDPLRATGPTRRDAVHKGARSCALRVEPRPRRATPRSFTGSAAVAPLALAVALGAVDALAERSRLAAQETVIVRGTAVQTPGRTPVEGALLTLVLEDGTETTTQTITGASGIFTLPVPGPGKYRIRVDRIGFDLTYTPEFEVPPGEPVTLQIVLRVVPVELDEMQVTADRYQWIREGFLAGFYERVERGNGSYLTREDLAKLPDRTLVELVPFMRGVTTVRAGADRVITMSRASQRVPLGLIRGTFARTARSDSISMMNAGREMELSFNLPDDFERANRCPIVYYLDGRALNPMNNPSFGSVELAYTLMTEQMEGIEIYSGPASTPGLFLGADAGCGVIAIWTRRTFTGEDGSGS